MNTRVLLVDANDDSRAGLAERLRRMRGLELVGQACDAADAAQIIGRTEADVVLIDLHGVDDAPADLCRALRSLIPAPLAVLASFMTPPRWEQLQEAGATQYLLKQVDTDGLRRALHELGVQYRARGRKEKTG